MTGKLRIWPKGTNFSNIFCQIYIKTQEKELVLFNGYMSDDQISQFNILINWEHIQLINMTGRDPRKVAQEELNDWAKQRNITAYTKPMIFLTSLKLALMSDKEQLNIEI